MCISTTFSPKKDTLEADPSKYENFVSNLATLKHYSALPVHCNWFIESYCHFVQPTLWYIVEDDLNILKVANIITVVEMLDGQYSLSHFTFSNEYMKSQQPWQKFYLD